MAGLPGISGEVVPPPGGNGEQRPASPRKPPWLLVVEFSARHGEENPNSVPGCTWASRGRTARPYVLEAGSVALEAGKPDEPVTQRS